MKMPSPSELERERQSAPAIPPPTAQDLERDLAADWATCEAVTPAALHAWGEDDLYAFVHAARTGWPAAIRLAQHLKAENDRLRFVSEGERKARELLLKGMESQAELMDDLKQEKRRLTAALKEAGG
jgi:hypothetical protein